MALSFITLDFETASHVDLKVAGAWRYAEDPTTEILCASYSIEGRSPALWTPAVHQEQKDTGNVGALKLLAEDPTVTFIAHNAGFEKAIWRRIMVEQFGFPDIPDHRWHDTMAVCAMKVLPQDLDRALMALRLPFEKDREGSALARSLSKPNKKRGTYDRTPETLQRVYTYCQSDVRAEDALHSRIGWLPPGERRVWLLDQKINERGVKLDLPFVEAAQQVVDRASKPLIKEFETVTGLQVGQRDKIMEWVRGQGVELPDLKKETLAALLGREEDDEENDDLGSSVDPDVLNIVLPGTVRRALGIRKLVGSASIKKLKRMDKCICADGNVYGVLQYHGAGPGRWAGRLIQPQNFPRGNIDREALAAQGMDLQAIVDAIMSGDPDYIELMTGYPAIDVVIASLRNALIPREGKLFAAGDFSTIELRVNLALACQWDKIDMLIAGVDPYIDMAQLIYKCKVDKKKDPEKRQTGKNSVLGLGFQMGAKKFQLKYAPNENLEFCEEVVRTFRKDWAPKIPYNWYELEGAAVRAVHDRTPKEALGVEYRLEDGWLSARLPSGRKLWYFNPQPCRKAMPWDDTDIRLAWTYQAMKMGQWKTIDAYGGLLTENVVQALARDLMVSAMFKCEQEGYPVCLTVHDEIVTEPDANRANDKELQQIMQDVPAWAKAMRIPVKADCWVGDRYKK